jgi:hypothetical protein
MHEFRKMHMCTFLRNVCTQGGHDSCSISFSTEKENASMNLWTALLLILVTTSCAQTVPFRETPHAPAALGEAKVSIGENNNTRIDLDIRHLAPPQNLTPPKSVYVVWVEAPDGKFANLGQITPGRDRSVEFRAVTPLRVFRIFITAEDRVLAGSPSDQIVLSTDVFRVRG